MKPLILMLFVAIVVQAQSLPDAARQERERRANMKPARVYTTEDARRAGESGAPDKNNATAPTSDAPAATPAPAEVKPPAPPAPPAVPAKPADDPVKRYNEELAKLREKIVQLQDKQVALQLQINDLKNEFLAPVTDESARVQANAKREEAEAQLTDTDNELAAARRSLQVLESQGPPKP